MKHVLKLKRQALRFADVRTHGKMHVKDVRTGDKMRPDRHNVTFCGISIPTEQYRRERVWEMEDMCEKCLGHLQHGYPEEWYSIEESET